MKDSKLYILVLFVFFVIIAFLDSEFSKIGVVGIVLTTLIYFLPSIRSKYELPEEDDQSKSVTENNENVEVSCEEHALQTTSTSQNVVVGLIFIDNVTEVLDALEDVCIPTLLALVERKITTFIQELHGIVRKFEKDGYLFIVTEEDLNCLKQKRFNILDQIREIDLGNTIPVTLSIGVGVHGSTLAESMRYAREALDLALSRGGDQVAIKEHEEYIFFGGTAKEVGSNTRVRARVKAYALSELVGESQNVIVMGHKNADLDSLGACIGIYKIATALGKETNIVLNQITKSTNILYDRLLLDHEYSEGVFLSSEDALSKTNDNTLIVVVDVYTPSVVEFPALLDKAKKIVVFDHHRKGVEFITNAALVYHEPYASSTCELITEMLSYIKIPMKLKPIEADALLAGITVDTKGFKVKTGARTFEAAACLRRKGADSTRITELFKEDRDEYRIKTQSVANAVIFRDNIAISVCEAKGQNQFAITAKVADELLILSGIEASFVLCSIDNKVCISARSIEKINVQVILEKLGGGGHQTAAGAQLSDIDIEKVKELLKTTIEEYLEVD